MSTPALRTNRAYWDVTAENYDHIFPETVIGKIQRDAVWRDLDKAFQPGQRILELNCGTGIDAAHLAKRGVQIVACDLSSKMLDIAAERLRAAGVQNLVDLRLVATEEIDLLAAHAPFDGAFSNFSGLNCVQDLSCVARSLARLLKPNAQAFLCLVGRFSPWEMAWHLARGQPGLALRRFRRAPSADRSVCGPAAVRYPSTRDMAQMFAPEFRLRGWKGIGITAPPSCLNSLAQKFPQLIGGLAKFDSYVGRAPILRSLGDCVLLQFEHLSE